MKRFCNSLFVLFAAVILMTSCQPPLYIPSSTNVPDLKKKGDVNVSYGIGANGHDFQGSYAIGDELGVMLNTSFASERSDSSSNYHKHAYVEGGVGGNFILNKGTYKSDKDPALVFSMYAAGGMGKAAGEYNYFNIFNTNIRHTSTVQGSYYKVYLQPALGMAHKNFDLFFTVRTGYVRFYNMSIEEDGNAYGDGYNYNFYHEPTLTIRGGSKNFKVFGQTGLSVGQLDNNAFRNRPILFTLGMQFHFDKAGSNTTPSGSESAPAE